METLDENLKPQIEPFVQNPINKDGSGANESFQAGWGAKYNTVQTGNAPKEERLEPYLKPEIKSFPKNPLNHSQEGFETGWGAKYNTVQSASYKK